MRWNPPWPPGWDVPVMVTATAAAAAIATTPASDQRRDHLRERGGAGRVGAGGGGGAVAGWGRAGRDPRPQPGRMERPGSEARRAVAAACAICARGPAGRAR